MSKKIKLSRSIFAMFTSLTVSLSASCMVDGVARYDTLSVRSGPSVHNEKLAELSPFASGIHIIKCLRKSNSSPWCKIKYRSGGATIFGWVNSRYLYCPVPRPVYNFYCVDRVSRYDKLNVHSKPYASSMRVGDLSPFTTGIHVNRCITRANGSRWCKISYGTGNARLLGWVNAKFIVPCGNY